MLKEQLERSLLLGIGLFALTRDKARALAEELVKQGHAARDEVAQVTEELIRRGEEERHALRKIVREEIDAALTDMHLATSSSVEALRAEIEALKAQLVPAAEPEAEAQS